MKTAITVLCMLAIALVAAPGVAASDAAGDDASAADAEDHCLIYVETRYFIVCVGYPLVDGAADSVLAAETLA